MKGDKTSYYEMKEILLELFMKTDGLFKKIKRKNRK